MLIATWSWTPALRAQTIDYLQIYVGTRTFASDPQADKLTQLPANFWAGYSPAQVLGATAYRQITDHWCLGAGFETVNAARPNYFLNISAIKTYAKYNFNNIEQRLSPYVLAGANYSFLSVRQTAYQEEKPADLSGVDPNTADIYNVRTLYREQQVTLLLVPVYGLHAGGGLEIKITEGYGIYAQYSYLYSFTNRSPLLRSAFPYQHTNLQNHSLIVGLRLFL